MLRRDDWRRPCQWLDGYDVSSAITAGVRSTFPRSSALAPDDATLSIDDAPAEREFQNVARLRLNAGFTGSVDGAHRACVLLGIVAAGRAVGLPLAGLRAPRRAR